MDRAEEIAAIVMRSHQLSGDYTEHLDEMVNKMVPTTLSNDEYAARCGALMIALSRELARCAATFGETHELDPEQINEVVAMLFSNHYSHCLAVIRGEGQTVN